MYLDIAGIPGESVSANANWNNKIEIQYFAYGIAVDHSMEVGTGVVASGAQCGHLNITKQMDISTPLLWAQLCGGDTIPDVYLRVTQPGPAGQPFEGEQYHMQWVVVSGFQTSGTPGSGNLPQENWQLSFIIMTETYQEVKDGVLQPAITKGFDFGQGYATA
jgi:type VI protein secretion system component Hcp